MTGPMTREAFIWAEFREMAPGRSARPTNPGRMAEYAGPNMALPTPIITTMKTRRTCEGEGARTTHARASENTSCSMERTMRNFLRSTLSAMRPPTGANRSAGPSWAKMMTPTNVLEWVRL